MPYATTAHVLSRFPGRTIGTADSSVTADHVTAMLEEAQGEIDQKIEEHDWHSLPIDLAPVAAKGAAAILRSLSVELVAARLWRVQAARVGAGEAENSAADERARLMMVLELPLPGISRREPLDSMGHLYDFTDTTAAVLAEANRRLRAYRMQRPRVMSATELEGSGVGVMLRPYLKSTPVVL